MADKAVTITVYYDGTTDAGKVADAILDIPGVFGAAREGSGRDGVEFHC